MIGVTWLVSGDRCSMSSGYTVQCCVSRVQISVLNVAGEEFAVSGYGLDGCGVWGLELQGAGSFSRLGLRV